MLKDEVLTRLSQLNRRTPVPVTLAKSAASQDRLTAERSPSTECSLGELSELPSGSEVENRWGKHWLREQPIEELWPGSGCWLADAIGRLRNCPKTRELQALAKALPARAVYLDLETCGFAGSMVFLVGLVHYQAGRFCLSQFLARHYGEEKAMFQTLWNLVADKQVLVTFNGKSFDWPMVLDRSTLHRLAIDNKGTHAEDLRQAGSQDGPTWNGGRPASPMVHCDLLHHARRRWKGKLPDCKLQTLERFVCGRRRTGDIPGREIPSAYHDFVRSGDAWPMRSVLHHNALDLVTLLQLSLKICSPVALQ